MPTKVLLVEDSATQAALVRAYLKSSGGDFEVVHVDTLKAACESLTGDDSEVVVLDLNLLDSAGIDTFRVLHARFPTIPIVILSGQDDEQLAICAVAEGAQDYLSKANFDAPLLARSLQYAIERNGRQMAERENLVMVRELDVARQIQQHLLPSAPPDLPGFDIATACQPAAACAGDFFDFITLDEEGVCDMLAADVSSHGFGAALIMVGARRMLRTCAGMHDDLGKILTIANEAVYEDTLPEQFVTLFYVRLDPATRKLHYSSAGHPAWIIGLDGAARLLDYEGLPLGLMSDTEYETYGPVKLQPGEILLLMTDGAWEAAPTEGEMFGWDRIFELVHENREQPAHAIVRSLVGEVTDHCHPHAVDDDVTVVVVKACEKA